MSKPLTDAVGNILNEKDLVVLKIGSETLTAHVIKVSHGGISIADGGGKPQETPPFVVFSIDPYTIICHPDRTGQINTRIGVCYRVVDPEQQAAVNKMAESIS